MSLERHHEVLSVYMVTMLLLGVSAPVPSASPSPAAVAPNAAAPPKPPASASCSRFFLREYMANMSAPTMMQAASTPIMMNTVELVPPESDSDETEPLLADAGSAPAVLLVAPSDDPVASEDDELLNEPSTEATLPEPLRELEREFERDVELEPDTLEDVDAEEDEDVDLDEEEDAELLAALEEPLVLDELEALEVELDAADAELDPDSHLSPLKPSLQVQPKLGVPSEAMAVIVQDPWPLHCTPFTLQPSTQSPKHKSSVSSPLCKALPPNPNAPLQEEPPKYSSHRSTLRHLYTPSRWMQASWPLTSSPGQLPDEEPPHTAPATQAWMAETESPATHVSPSAQSAVLEQLTAIRSARAEGVSATSSSARSRILSVVTPGGAPLPRHLIFVCRGYFAPSARFAIGRCWTLSRTGEAENGKIRPVTSHTNAK
jgi:hypothetical protein